MFPSQAPNINILDTWLKAKGDDIKNRDINITTQKKYFENYINEVES